MILKSKFSFLYVIIILIGLLTNYGYSQNPDKEINPKSIELFKKALDTLGTATIQTMDARSKIALQLFDKSIKIDSNNVPSLMWKSMILGNMKKYSEAKKIIYTAIRKSKQNKNFLLAQLYMSLGGIFLLEGNKKQSDTEYANALKEYQRVLKLQPCDMDAIGNIPMIYAIINQKNKAYSFIDKNKKCYQGANIEQLKGRVKEFDMKKYIEQMNKK